MKINNRLTQHSKSGNIRLFRHNQQSKVVSKGRYTQSGFTMVELVVGTFLASVISLAVFTVFVDSSEYYGKQLDQTQAQSSLRFAMEYVKGDLHDFGRLSIQNTDLRVRDPDYCGAGQYQGLDLIDNDPGGEGF